MAKPNGISWKDHQHVIMAINIKSDTSFEQTDDAKPVFYGSTKPFTLTETGDSGKRISITGTNVKNYGDLNKTSVMPILLVTRVRDIENGDIDDLDKRYIICSNVVFDANTITVTIATVYKGWNSLPQLLKIDMEDKMNIFERRKTNRRLEKLLTNARKSVAKVFAPTPVIAEPVKPAVTAPILAKSVDSFNPPDFRRFNSAREFFESTPYKKWVKTYRDNHSDETPISSFKGNVTSYFAKKFQNTLPINRNIKKFGGAHNDELSGLIDRVSNNDNGFKKYVYFLLTQPFYFKLNALTPTMLTKIKSYVLSGPKIRPNTSFEQHILQPFTNFAYVEYTVKIPNDTDLSKDGDLSKNLSDLIAHSISTDTVPKFARQIKKDTKNYKQLTNSKPTMYYIHIFRFIELIENLIENVRSQPMQPEHVTVFIRHALSKIYEHMQQVTPLFDLLSSIDTILIQDKSGSQTQRPLHVYIDDYVSSQNRTDVITYLKITNTEPETMSSNKSWNQRYDIRLKQSSLAGETYYKFNAMILGYKIYPSPFYKQITYGVNKKKTIAAVDGLDGIVTYKTAVLGPKEIEKVNEYDKYYLFGNYENIFPLYKTDGKKETNSENAAHMTAIIEQICTHNKPVFLLGYGASGSGKTSSLIYFNKGKTPDEQNGIVIHLCKKIIEKLQTTEQTRVKTVNVVVKEFYMTNDMQTHVSDKYIFNTELNTSGGVIREPNHTYHVDMNKPLEEFKTMGQVLKQLVDVDRYVKATTNNPQSSRSHVLVFIQFCSDDIGRVPIRNLIIGDFAGKENEFQCADTETVVAFLNKKVENKEIIEHLNSKLPIGAIKPETYTFYGAQLMQSGGDRYANDPINKLVDNKTFSVEELANRNTLQSAGMLFDFENPSNSINIADLNNPAKYDSFKTIADQYAPIVIKHYFKDEPQPTDVQSTKIEQFNNSKIYKILLNNTYHLTMDTGIEIIKKYRDRSIPYKSNMKAAVFLKELILVDLFENFMNESNLNHAKLSQAITSLSGSGSKVLTAMADITRYNKNKYGETESMRRLKLITDSPYIIEEPGYAEHMNRNHVDKINEIIEFANKPQSDWANLDWLNKSIIERLAENYSAIHNIYLYDNFMPTYKDPFDRSKEKFIPIEKSFTVSTMCKFFMNNRFKSLLPFFKQKKSGKIGDTETNFYTANTLSNKQGTHNYINEFRYILNSLITPANDLNDYITLLDIYQKNIMITQVRLKHGKEVCENRVIEGKYINSSLDKIRQAIKYVLNKKHEKSDAVFHSPDFIDICLQSYCPSGINCFNTSSTDNAPESLIDEIYNHIYANQNDKDQFYKDIVISVFGVFNVSRLADNPPQVPYIDINHLKQIYYNNDTMYSQEYPLLWALYELKVHIEKLPKEHIKMLPLIEYVSEENQGDNLPLIDTLTKLIDAAKHDYSLHNKGADILSIARSSISDNFMNALKEIIEAIDIHNAASTIGTLEFLDQLAKFNSVNNLCYKNTDYYAKDDLDDKDGEANDDLVDKVLNTTPYLDDDEYNMYVTNAAQIKPA